jgi:hypothetical protein
MKIKYGAIVVDGRGKLGGHVASKNRGGNYLRTKVTPVNPQTAAQTNVRAIFGGLASGWSALTEAQRDSFNGRVQEYAKTDIFGDLKAPSGKALYQRLNQNLALTGQAAITTCPAAGYTPFAEDFEVNGDVSSSTLEIEFQNDLTGYVLMVFATAPVSQGTNYVKNRLRMITAVGGTNAAPITIFNVYQQAFGTPAVGDKIFIGVKVVNDGGGASPLQTVVANIVA